jgi:YVTN family beta-propeller protein
VARVDPQTNTVAAQISMPGGDALEIVADDEGVYVPNFDEDTVSRIDPATNTVTATIQLAAGAAPVGITATPGAVWVADHHGQAISRIDTASNTVVATIPTGGAPGACCGPQQLTVGAGSLWAGVPNSGSVVRIDPTTNTVIATIPVGNGVCGDLAADQNAVWVTNSGCAGNPVTRIDPTTNQPVPAPKNQEVQMTGAAIVNGNVYLAVNQPKPSLLRVDAATNTITGYLALPGFSTSGDLGHTTIAYGAGSLWVRGFGEIIRIQPNT